MKLVSKSAFSGDENSILAVSTTGLVVQSFEGLIEHLSQIKKTRADILKTSYGHLKNKVYNRVP